MRGATVFLFAAVLTVAAPSGADGPTEVGAPEIAERLAALRAHETAREVAGDALAHARRALEQAEQLERRGRPAAAVRARQIAASAVLLVQRKLALAQERAALRKARVRLEEARERARAARHALERTAARHDEVASADADPDAESGEADGRAGRPDDTEGDTGNDEGER